MGVKYFTEKMRIDNDIAAQEQRRAAEEKYVKDIMNKVFENRREPAYSTLLDSRICPDPSNYEEYYG